MEKLLIYRDEKAVEFWKEKRESLNLNILEFGKMLKESNLNFNKEIFSRFIKEGTGYVWMLLRGQSEKDFEKMQLNSEVAKENLLKGIKEKSKEFEDIHKKISRGFIACQIQPKNITITRGVPVITEKEIEVKKEELTIYAETENQQKLYDLQKNLCKSFNDLEAFLKAHKQPSIFKMGSPDNMEAYISTEKDPGFKIPETQQKLGLMWPMEGEIICKPNHNAIKNLPE